MSRETLRVSLAAACVLGWVAAEATAGEVMQDRCKQDVAFIPSIPNVPNSRLRPGMPGTVILKRKSDDRTDWSRIFEERGSGGRVDWWCYTGSGSGIEPGVWRVNESDGFEDGSNDGKRCLFSGDTGPDCHPDPNVKHTSKVWEHWSSESSRCKDRSNTRFRARLGPHRSLQIECMGK